MNRRTTDRHRPWTFRDVVLGVAAIVGVMMVAYSSVLAHQANERAERAEARAERVAGGLRQEVRDRSRDAEDTADTLALRSYQACLRGNRETRPAARLTAQILADLVAAVNTGVTDVESPLVQTFLRAPQRLRRAIRLLAPTDCRATYPEGYRINQQRGGP